MCHLLVVVVVWGAVAVSGTSSKRVTSVITTGPPESVFDWQSEHCATGRPLNHQHPPKPYQRDVPDAPAMAWRDPVSNLTFVAPGDSRGTWPSVGPSLSEVRKNCSLMIFNYSGPTGWMTSPSAFASHEWLYAPFVIPPAQPGGNATVYMLVHNEFHGFEFESEGLCNASVMIHGRCWYNSVTLSVSYDGGLNFHHFATPPAHLVAASFHEYVPNRRMYGAFSPSQIVTNPHDGFHYSFPVYVGYNNGGVRGVCSMRTKDISDPHSWRFRTGGAYTGVWIDPYTTTSHDSKPDILSNVSLSQPVPRYLPHLDLFVMSGYTNDVKGGHFGVSTSKDPWGPWSELVLIPADINPTHDAGHQRGLYPSLLDPNSPSLNYDTLESADVYVYWVQGRNKTVVNAPDMARDLWRQPIRLITN